MKQLQKNCESEDYFLGHTFLFFSGDFFFTAFQNFFLSPQFKDLKFFLEDSLGYPVDVVSKKMLKPQIRDVVETEVIYVS